MIKVGVVYVNVQVSRHLKEELAWVIRRYMTLGNSIKMLFKTVISLIN